MKPWTKILPFFIVEWLAKTICQRYRCRLNDYDNDDYVQPFDGCLFLVGHRDD